MERLSAREDIHHLFEQMYNALDRRVLDRDLLRDYTDQISTLAMVRVEPGRDILWHGVHLSPQKRAIADYLLARFGKVVRKGVLADVIAPYGKACEGKQSKVVDVHICQMRKILKGTPYRLQTVHGAGVALVNSETFFPAIAA